MATVTLRGRFPKGTRVRLVEVRDEAVLRSEGGKEVGQQKVGDDGSVSFTRGVKAGQRYMIVGRVNGRPLEVRAIGRKDADEAAVVAQTPIGPDRVRLSDGSWADEAPSKEQAPSAAAVSAPSQQQARDVIQRSSTPRGQATPQDVKEQLPYPDQESVKKGTIQMSDTPVGQATPVAATPERQDQVPDGVVQRSATPVGVATPIPVANAVAAQREKESSVGKAIRGEPGRVAAEPLKTPIGERSEIPNDGDDTDEKADVEPDGDEQGASKAAGSSVEGAKGPEAVKKSAGGAAAAPAKRKSAARKSAASRTRGAKKK